MKYPVSHKNILDSIGIITKNDTIKCTYGLSMFFLIQMQKILKKNNFSVVSNGFTGPCAILGGGPRLITLLNEKVFSYEPGPNTL